MLRPDGKENPWRYLRKKMCAISVPRRAEINTQTAVNRGTGLPQVEKAIQTQGVTSVSAREDQGDW